MKLNLPNKLTILRIIMIPIFVAVFYVDFPFHYLVSAIVFALAAFTDFLDGKIARKYNLVTNLGKFLDPIADKVLVSTALILLLAPLGEAIMPWYMSIVVAIILARELMVSGFRMVAASKNVILSADKSGKIKTFCQDIAILVLLIGACFMSGIYTVINIVGLSLLGVAGVLTIYSGTHYIVKNIDVLKD
ncbi:MAG: CDP-diacylglycerol--glycerol-3-phosphate 3-phosphatidyltransferase [Firmicutes bacterium]|nr:CDP-diacylglycerol--glycerol-3-phosphate 3-phosphatidyltransferase [Candidatus Caballimonas caccae]